MKKQLINRELLYDLHINQKLTVSEIARKLDKTFGVVKTNLKTHGIECVKYKINTVSKKRQLIDKDVLLDLHITKELSIAEIARQLDKSFHVVKANLVTHGIEFVEYRKIIISKDLLSDLHINQKLSVSEISKIYDVDCATIRLCLTKHDIEISNVDTTIILPKEELKVLHHDKELTLAEIAEIFGCSGGVVAKKKFDTDCNLVYHDSLTERELAKLNGLLRVYDAGKIRYEMINGGN